MADNGVSSVDSAFLSPANARTVIGVVCAFGPLTILSTAARIYSRWRYVGLKLDDWFMFVSMLFYVVLCIAVIVGAKNATGLPGSTFADIELAVDVSTLCQAGPADISRCLTLAKCSIYSRS
jgi:hypothetical protein